MRGRARPGSVETVFRRVDIMLLGALLAGGIAEALSDSALTGAEQAVALTCAPLAVVALAFRRRAPEASFAALFAIVAVWVVLAYGWCARVMGWLPAAALGWAAFIGMTFLLDQVDPPNWLSFVVVCSSFALAAALLPRDPAEPAGSAPRFDLLLRAVATAALVLALTGLAGALGPRLSGLLASFPVLATVLAAFTHAQEGPAAAAQLLRGFATGLVAFAAFCFAVAELLPRSSVAVAFLASAGIALVAHALSFAVQRAIAGRARP